MRVKLDYGKTGLEVTVPDDRLIAPPLSLREVPPLANAEQAIEESLRNPIGTPPLSEMAR